MEAIYGGEPLTGTPPDGFAWSPDGKLLSYVANGELVGLDVATGKPQTLVSREKLQSLLGGSGGTEQDRDHRARYKMESYWWAPDSGHLLFDADGRLWLFDLKTGTGTEMGFTGAAAGDNPTFSPNGEIVAFVRDHGLSVMHLKEGFTTLGPPVVGIAAAPNSTTLNGEVDWVYAEELDVRSNYSWSPDSKNIAFLQMNETNVPEYPLTDWIPVHAKAETQRYPQAGDLNPEVRVGVVSAGGGKVAWVKLPIHGGQDYIPRFGWVDRHTLWIETLSRDHKTRTVYFADPWNNDGSHGRTALQTLVVTDDKFLDENYDVWVGNGAIVLTSWVDGHNHVYVANYDQGNPLGGPATPPRQVTKGTWDVGSVLAVDTAKQMVFYTSNEFELLDRQIARVSFAGERRTLTQGAGTHEGNVAPGDEVFVDTFSTRTTPPRISLCHVGAAGGESGSACKEFWASKSLDAYKLHAPVQIETKAKDGTVLYATLMLPEGEHGNKSVPVILNPYGGPTGQTVLNRWGDNVWGDKFLFDALLAQHGFAVLRTDNRGTPGRGRDFVQAAYRDFGKVQLEDQLTMLDEALEKFPELDGKRVGVWGWSWGGTFTLYAMTHSDRFQAGVSVAPVTDWRDYDSVYTERYLGIPFDEQDLYKRTAVVETAKNLHGRLLLAHGTGDDNVHIENTVQFVEKLIEAGIPYDLQIFPRKTHEILGGTVRPELFNRIVAHFEQYLQPAAKPE